MQNQTPTKEASATAEGAQHTPGPWEISNPGYMNGAIVVHGNQAGDGATNDVAYCDGENKAANARLIAAAPELLRVAQIADNFGGIAFEDCAGYRACIKELVDAARSTISKAEGR